MRTCAHPDCARRLTGKGDLCRSHRMKALHANPEFAERNRERMKALHADPEFNPLAALTPEQREDYAVLKKARFSRASPSRRGGVGGMPSRFIPRATDDRILAALALRDRGVKVAAIARRLGFGPAVLRVALARVDRDYAASCAPSES